MIERVRAALKTLLEWIVLLLVVAPAALVNALPRNLRGGLTLLAEAVVFAFFGCWPGSAGRCWWPWVATRS